MNSMRICYISLILLLISSYYSFSESSKIDSTISISGQILHAKSLAPIPLATITIKKTRKGIICDSIGIFHLQIQQSDTLRISALGYKPTDWEVPFVFNPDSPPFFQIKLEDISYLLGEVDIYALGTWDEFKEEFIKSKLEEKNPINESIIKQLAPYNTKEPNLVPARYRPNREGKMGVIDAIFRPTDFLFDKFSKTEKSKKKISKIIRNETKTKKISSKYNAEIIANATGLKGNELLQFMEYSGSHIKATPNSTDYYIMKQILFWFKKYQEETTEEE